MDAGTVPVFTVQHVETADGSTPYGTRLAAIPNMGHGTGFGVPGDYHLIMTAAHVVEDARYVVVRLPGDGAFYPARVAYRNDEQDTAVLVVEGAVPSIAMRPVDSVPRTRQAVFTVGYPLDASRRQAQSARGRRARRAPSRRTCPPTDDTWEHSRRLGVGPWMTSSRLGEKAWSGLIAPVAW